MGVFVNKKELAKRVLKCSLPTLDALIERYPDFPVEQRGSNGVEWRFDAEAVTAYLAGQREAAQRELEAKQELFQQFSLPIDEIAPDESKGLTPRQRADMARARKLEREEALEVGQLVLRDAWRGQLERAVAALARRLDSLPGQLGQAHGLPDEVVRAVRQTVEDWRRNLMREIEAQLSDGGAPIR